MKTLYLNLGMGAAGDMLTAALFELLTKEEKEQALKALEDLQIPGVKFVPERSEKCGIVGTHMSVMINGIEESEETIANAEHEHEHSHEHEHEHSHEHPHEHEHSHEHDHEHEHTHDHEHSHEHEHSHDHEHSHEHPHEHEHSHGDGASVKMNLPENVREHFREVYRIIGKAESKAHGVPVTKVHFHEVGEVDAVADIAAASLLMEMIKPDQVIASPINVGHGQVRCAHGIMPVPTPATANILKGVPIYSNQVRGELCTPTGAALVKHFATSYGPMPEMIVSRIGYGMGKKDFEAANCVVAMLGDTTR